MAWNYFGNKSQKAAALPFAAPAAILVPPTGYAVMMARSAVGQKAPIRDLARALAPYLGAQLVVLALVVLIPGLAHLAQPKGFDASPLATKMNDDDARKKFNDMLKIPPPEE